MGLELAFEELRSRVQSAVETGQLDEAARLADQALAWAREHGDVRQLDLAVCNQASVATELGRGEGHLPELRQVLMRNSDDENCFLAAYNIARVYELKKSNKKATFYARIARDRAETVGRREWLASAHNLTGNLLLAESFFAEAVAEFEQALRLVPETAILRRALIKDNLGYACLVQGRHREGFTLLFESLRVQRRLGASRYGIQPRLSLCYGYLEVGRFRLAVRHGRTALAEAEALADVESVKHALFLLGEAANLMGEYDLARRYFSRLQLEFYPDAGYLPDFLLAIDVRKLVNLKA